MSVDLQDRPEGFRRVNALLAEQKHPHAPLFLEVAARTAQEVAARVSPVGPVGRADAEFVKAATGFTIGGVAPVRAVVLVFFWSTDCAVCRDKMPELRLNYEAWRSKGFQLVAVILDKSLAAVHDYQGILDRMVPKAQRFPSLWRGAAAHRDNFGPMLQTPTTFVLDRKHKVVNEIRGRIAPSLWDDVAKPVLA